MPSKANISAKLEDLLNGLGSQCARETKERAANAHNAPTNMLANEEFGVRFNPYAWSKIHDLFSQEQPNDELLKSVNASDPGNSGDLVLCNAQIDYLSMMERAFRARHTMTFPRCIAHHCARRKGQGSDAGPLKYGVLDYLRDLKKTSSGS